MYLVKKSSLSFSKNYLIGTSALTLAIAAATPAYAQSIPVVDGETIEIPEGQTNTLDGGDLIFVDNADNVTINNNGTLINTGTGNNDNVIDVDDNEENAVINNNATGILRAQQAAIFDEGNNTVINNAGLIEGLDDLNEGAIILDRDSENATITNSGVIQSVGGGTAIGIDLDENNVRTHTITNTGTIQALDDNDSAGDGLNFDATGTGVVSGVFNGTVTNSGTIQTSSSNSSAAGIRIEDDAIFSGTIDNLAGGLIQGVDNGFRIGVLDHNGGTINNTGTISSGDNAIRIDGGGFNINNLEGGTIFGESEGIFLAPNDLFSSGTIVDRSFNITVNNAGGIFSNNIGILTGGIDIDIINSGAITGSAVGISVLGGGQDTNDDVTFVDIVPGENTNITNNGFIASDVRAISIEGLNTVVTNNGAIAGTGDQSAGVIHIGSDAENTSVANFGLIEANEGLDGSGVFVEADALGASINITNQGTIGGRGTGHGIELDGVNIDGAPVAGANITATSIISNAGTIRAESGNAIDVGDVIVSGDIVNNGSLLSASGSGIEIDTTAVAGTITNNGFIQAAVGISSASGGTIVNNGTTVGQSGAAISTSGAQNATVSLGLEGSGAFGQGNAVELLGTGINTLNIAAGGGLGGNVVANADLLTDTLNLSGDGASDTIQAQEFDVLQQTGGDFVLGNATTDFTEGAAITGGSLIVDGTIEGDAIVSNSAALAGGGTIGGTLSVLDAAIGAGSAFEGVSVGTLNLGGLALTADSILNFDLGAPDTPGSSDLINVAGDVILDGTLNATDAGGFGIGVYRLIDFTGSLTDNGLEIGAIPAGFDAANGEIQTSMAGQVNFVLSAADDGGGVIVDPPVAVVPTLQFFDGADMMADGMVDGGGGSFNLVDTNFTNAAGDENLAFAGNFVVFSNVGGTVTVDDNITLNGVQFTASGYDLANGTGSLTVTDLASVIRLDDGTSTTISADIGGMGGLDIIGGGDLDITGTSTFTGDTNITGGSFVTLDGSLTSDINITGDPDANALATIGGIGSTTGTLTAGALSQINAAGSTASPFTVGNLILANDTTLSFGLGDPNDPTTSNFINVDGDLTLDGQLNVLARDNFGVGVYRLINFGGTLTDNGLELQSLPNGFDVANAEIQTSVANQINFILSDPIIADEVPFIQFFDGADMMADGVVDGGSGSLNLVDTNLTNAAGDANAAFGQNFIVFSGAAGTVTVDDDLSFFGTQFITDGYELANGTGSLSINEAQTAVRVDPMVTATISANIGGTGGLNKLDSGTLILSGANIFTGDTNVSGGLLVVDGSLASTVSVADGASLGGIGTLGGLNVTGILAPGNSIGTLNVAGDVNFAADSIFAAEIASSGASDLLAATGAVTINGGTVQVLAEDTNFLSSTDFTIITADGGVTGAFDTVTTNLAFLTPTVNVNANSVTLNVTRNDIAFAAIGQTANQVAVASAIDAQGSGTLVDALVVLDAPTAQAALNQLSGDIHPSVQAIITEDSRLIRNSIFARGSRADDGAGLWGQVWGNLGTSDATINAAEITRDSYGFQAGIDAPISDDLIIGVTAAYSDTDFDNGSRLATGNVASTNIAAYFGLNAQGFTISGGLGFGFNDVDTSRSVSLNGLVNPLTASYDADTFQAFTEVGYRFGSEKSFVEPFANLSLVRVDIDGFTESAGAASLSAQESDLDSNITTLGLRFGIAQDSKLSLNAKLGWQHRLSDLQSETAFNFTTGPSFISAGSLLSRNAAVAQVEALYNVSDKIDFGLSYDGSYGSDSQDHALFGRVTFSF